MFLVRIDYVFIRNLSRLIAILLVALNASGCSAIQQTYGIRETDLSWIKRSMHRAEIESKLDLEIIKEVHGLHGTTVIYKFNRGYRPPAHDSSYWWPVAAVGWETINLMSLGAVSFWERECQRALLELSYGPDGTLIGASEQMMVEPIRLNAGTKETCDRIRAHLKPSTLAID